MTKLLVEFGLFDSVKKFGEQVASITCCVSVNSYCTDMELNCCCADTCRDFLCLEHVLDASCFRSQ